MLISAFSPSNSLQIYAYLPKRLGSMHKRLFQLCAQLRGQLAHLCFRQLGMTHGKLNAHTISQESLGKFNLIFFSSCLCCFLSSFCCKFFKYIAHVRQPLFRFLKISCFFCQLGIIHIVRIFAGEIMHQPA